MVVYTFAKAIEELWTSRSSLPFGLDHLVVQMHLDGGHDFRGVRVEDLDLLLRGKTPTDWTRVVNFSQELLSFYKAYEGSLSVDQLVIALFCAYILARADKVNITDFSMYNDALIGIVARFPDDVIGDDHVVSALSQIYSMLGSADVRGN
jgi:hypothetical protein